jgi:hypothetical protein
MSDGSFHLLGLRRINPQDRYAQPSSRRTAKREAVEEGTPHASGLLSIVTVFTLHASDQWPEEPLLAIEPSPKRSIR